jgi:hypothetical protein
MNPGGCNMAGQSVRLSGIKKVGMMNIAVMGALAALMTACSPTQFDTIKEATISKSVLSGAQAVNADVQIPVTYMCSNRRTDDAGSNVKEAKDLEMQLRDITDDQVKCKESAGVREAILNAKELPVSACANLNDGNYIVEVVDPSAQAGKGSRNLLQDPITVSVKNGKAANIASVRHQKASILYDINIKQKTSDPRLSRVVATAGSSGSGSAGADAGAVPGTMVPATDDVVDDCDQRASPLIVDMSPESSSPGIELSSPIDGILFDILGGNSFPVSHSKKQISWLRDPNYMFLVLPNHEGKVNGIDELFGDNTLGSDGRYSKNGYTALAKYDGRTREGDFLADADQRIDSKDPIFNELRLWSDRNGDGIAQESELFTLDQKNIDFIDLRYDSRYLEKDAYGNETRYKSVVALKDGSLRLLFDIWFRYL